MQEVWIIEQKHGNEWKLQMYLGIHRWETNATAEMHRHIKIQPTKCEPFPICALQRGEGKRVFNMKSSNR